VKLRTVIISASIALAAGGALLAYVAQSPQVQNESLISKEPRHVVTAAMDLLAGSWQRKTAPHFATADYLGEKVDFAGTLSRPQFVYFIKDGCPCSFEVEPLFKSLARKYKGKIDFVGVIDKGEKEARQWSTDLLVEHPIVPDPQQQIMAAYGATNSAFSALVSKDGKVVQMWPGYSRDILQEMNVRMANELGEKATTFDPQWAPVKRSAGCVFDWLKNRKKT
jgi:hypothetical protein